jgi:hypothetical protein
VTCGSGSASIVAGLCVFVYVCLCVCVCVCVCVCALARESGWAPRDIGARELTAVCTVLYRQDVPSGSE